MINCFIERGGRLIAIDTSKCKRACKGDQNVFTELVMERKDDIYRIAYSYVKDREETLEILHETIYKAYISVRKLKNPELFNVWLVRITINCSIDFLKRKNRISKHELKCFETKVLEEYPDNSMSISDMIIGVDLMNAIDKLEVQQKTVVILKYYQDFTITQIAECMSWPVGTVKTHFHKALKSLRLELKEAYQ